MAKYRRFAGPAALLVAVTIAVVLIRVFAEHPAKHKPTYGLTVIATTSQRPKFYVVGAGDTLAKIAALYHLPLATIRRLNPHVSATNLFIGEKIKLR